jgi:uncharacterized BrkB/YihY/UPF0761 family membrane protein
MSSMAAWRLAVANAFGTTFRRAFDIGLWFRSTALSERRGGLECSWAAKPETKPETFGMDLLLLLALAVPLSCLAFLSSVALLGIMTLGGVIHLVGTVRARRPQ